MTCIEKIPLSAAQELLSQNNTKLADYTYQLPTNFAFIYRLPTGQVVLIPSMLSPNPPTCLVFDDQKCFDDCVANDHFPIEDYDENLFNQDVDSLKVIHTKIPAFQHYLNTRYKLDLSGLSRDIADAYYVRVSKDKTADSATVLALGAIMGEVLRIELKATWVLQKRYSAYNPYYVPMILVGDRLILVYDRLISTFDGRQKSKFFFETSFSEASKAIYDEAGISLITLQY